MNLVECATCGYPLTKDERTGLTEINGKMHKSWAGLSRGEKLGIIDRHTMRSYDDQQDLLFAIMSDTNDLLKEKNHVS